MAMIDYGCLVFKNGVLVNENEFFQDMKEAVGWSDDEKEYPKGWVGSLDGNFFGYIGDPHLTVAFYKRRCVFVMDGECVGDFWGGRQYEHCEGVVPKKTRSYQISKRFIVDGHSVHLKDITDGKGGVYRLTMRYKGDDYRVVFGYGVDPNMRVWHEAKRDYLPSVWRKVENEFHHTKKRKI